MVGVWLQGKVFPKLRRKSSNRIYSSSLSSQSSELSTDVAPSADDEEEADYVFHIVASSSQNYSLRAYPLQSFVAYLFNLLPKFSRHVSVCLSVC